MAMKWTTAAPGVRYREHPDRRQRNGRERTEGRQQAEDKTKKGLMHILHKSLKSIWCRGTELNCRHGDFQSPYETSLSLPAYT